MENNYTFSLYEGNDAFEAARLRSILIFNSVGKERTDNDMMLKALFSLIIDADNKATKENILETLKVRFSVDWTEKVLDTHLSMLKQMGLADINEQGYIVALEQRKDGREYIRGVIEETDVFLNALVSRLKEVYTAFIPDESLVKKIFRKSLSAYLSQSSFEFFDVKAKAKEQETIDVISFIHKEVAPVKLADAMIRVLADMLMNPTDEENDFLEQWARAYIAMQVIGLDPSLSNFKDSKLKDKSFVIDTDIVLNFITKHAKYSEMYHQMFKKLKNIGCHIYLPTDVFTEVERNCKAANTKYLTYGASLLEMTDEHLEQSIGNVLVEDYVKTIKADPSMNDYRFDDYLSNIYDRNNPALLRANIIDVIGEENFERKLPEYDAIEDLDSLKSEILGRTERSQKGIERPKEINQELSDTDAQLYYTICKMNEDTPDDKFFSRRVYLLTRSRRTGASAKEVGMYRRNVICHPEALYSIMAENGVMSTGELRLVNLFDNPFLVYAAKQIWEQVDPMLKAGVKLKHAVLNKLRLDVDSRIDAILTSKSKEERYEVAKQLDERGYDFAKIIVEAKEEAEREKKKAQQAQKDAAEYKKMYEDATSQLREREGLIDKLIGKLGYYKKFLSFTSSKNKKIIKK